MEFSRRDLIAAMAVGLNTGGVHASANSKKLGAVTPANNIQQRDVLANGIRIHIAEQGTGPLVLLCHGFPEGWYSWRHQLPALAVAGYHAVAPDMRGYGHTDAPPDIAS